MLQKLKTLAQIIKIMRSGQNLGDIAVLKVTLFQANEGDSAFGPQALALKERNFDTLELDQLGAMPEGSFGRAYYDFMLRNGLQPFNFSEQVRGLYERYPVTIRYARVHDMFHTLLGFEADLAGETGVYAFVGQQNYSGFLNKAARVGRRMRWFFFWKFGELSRAWNQGVELSQGTKALIAEPLEDYLLEPLSDVRRRLGIQEDNNF